MSKVADKKTRGWGKRLNNEVFQIVTGSLLGDGSVYLRKRCKNAQFVETHSLKQADYLKWKADIFTPHFGGSRLSYNKKRDFEEIHLFTHVHPLLTELRKMWYPNGKKVIPEQELQKLDELGLAVWYQDDGTCNYRSRCCELAIHSFKEQEIIIQNWFKEKWGLDPSITSGPSLRFSVKDSDKFLRLIAEHIHPSMIYKLGWRHPSNKSKCEAARKKERDGYQKSGRKWRKKNPLYSIRYHFCNRERTLQKCREYREKNREILRQKSINYYWGNREKILSRKRHYWNTHKDEINRKRRESYSRRNDEYSNKKLNGELSRINHAGLKGE